MDDLASATPGLKLPSSSPERNHRHRDGTNRRREPRLSVEVQIQAQATEPVVAEGAIGLLPHRI